VYARDIIVFSVATYVVAAVLVGAYAEPIVRLFVGNSGDATIPVAVTLVYAACLAVVGQGVKAGITGPLDASGDTPWPFYSQIVGMFGAAIPIAYLGATTSLGLWGLYLSFLAEATIPAAINYYRFSTGKWKAISREFRPDSAAPADD
jgi:Na+-driven multidrug efflux pump